MITRKVFNDIIMEELHIDDLPGELSFEDLGCDSLDIMEIIIEIEEETGQDIPDEVIRKFTHPEELFQYLKYRLSGE